MAQIMSVAGPIVVALVYISLCSLFREPNRQNFNAIMIAGAGAAYLNGGFGLWEFAFLAVVTYCAFRGLRSYNPTTTLAWDGSCIPGGTCCITSTAIPSYRLPRVRRLDVPFATL